MKIYLVYFSVDKHEEETLKAVFDSERKALDYVIQQLYSSPFYHKMIPSWLDDNARPHIEEWEVK